MAVRVKPEEPVQDQEPVSVLKIKVAVACKNDGFRRLGRVWASETVHEELTEEDVVILERDPAFVVIRK